MGYFKSDAMKDMSQLQERMNKIFSDSLKRIRELTEPDRDKPWSPVVDIYEQPGAFVLAVELPGVAREDVSLEVVDQSLIIKGQRPPLGEAAGSLYRAERHSGPFERTFNLPVDVAAETIQAKLTDGVLTVTVPKPEASPTRIKVDIG